MAYEIPTIYWSANGQQGNKRLQKLHPDMLKPQGYKVLRKRVLKGAEQVKSIHYDIHYVVSKFVADFLEPLELDVDEFAEWLKQNRPLIRQTTLGSLPKEMVNFLFFDAEQESDGINHES